MKKYLIFNSENYSKYLSCYLFYIILIAVVIFILYNTYNNNSCSYYNEDFAQLSNKNNESDIKSLMMENKNLSNTLNTLQDKVNLQQRLQYISDNFIKIDESSFPDELRIINLYFKSIDLPEIDISIYKVISSQTDFDEIIKKAKNFVNIYNPGDIVSNNSDFNIDKNKICYKNADKSYISTHPDCMVCSVNDEYLNSPNWKNTKTNIQTVCVFDKNAAKNSGIPNEDECKNYCNISN